MKEARQSRLENKMVVLSSFINKVTFKSGSNLNLSQTDLIQQIEIRKQTDRNWGRNLAIAAADVVGIAVDVVYRLITTLFYGASILKTIKWFFFILNFVG